MGDALCDRCDCLSIKRIELLCSTPPVQLYLESFRLPGMADQEKAKVKAAAGVMDMDMDQKWKKAIELNNLREKWSDQFIKDNPDSVNFFGVGSDANNIPAIVIGVDPSADVASLIIPDEIREQNIRFDVISRVPQRLPLKIGALRRA